MPENSGLSAAESYFLKPGYIYVPRSPTMISTVLGSCVAVCLYDGNLKRGGMNHFPLPSTDNAEQATARFGNVATMTLIKMMVESGSSVKDLEAQIFGGAFRAQVCPVNIGQKNVAMARMILGRKKIPVLSEDAGGEKGGKVIYNTGSNEVVVIKVDKIRHGDWFPYLAERK